MKLKRALSVLVTAILVAMSLSLAGLAESGANVTAGAYVGTVPTEGLYSDLGQVTLLVNGVDTKVVPGTTYTQGDNAVVVITDAAGGYANFTKRPSDDYRTALFVDSAGVVADKSVTGAVSGGTFDNTGATGVTVDSTSDNFNGVMVTGGEYTVADSTFDFLGNSDGSDTSDFTGLGAVLSAFGADTKLTAKNVNIHTTGVARAALVTDEGADALVEDSTLTVEGGTLYEGYQNSADQSVMVAPPWVLGIAGTARATNLLGSNSTNTFVRSTITATGWGALSTDDSTDVTLTAIDSTVNVTGDPKTVGGYGTYAIGNAVENFFGTAFNVSTFANIITGGTVSYASSGGVFDIVNTLGETVFSAITGLNKVSSIVSQAFGVMFHSQGGTVNIADGTTVDTQNAAFLVKGADATISVDSASITTADGVILQVMDSDDAAVGVADSATTTFNTTYTEQEGYPGIDYTAASSTDAETGTQNAGNAPDMGNPPSGTPGTPPSGEQAPQGDPPSGNTQGDGNPPQGQAPGSDGQTADTSTQVVSSSANVNATFTNVTLTGSLYNATGYTGTGETLAVDLGTGAALTGTISATSAIHSTDGGVTQNVTFTIDEFWKLGHVWNKPYYNGANSVDVTLTDGAQWIVTDTSVLTSLTLGEEWMLGGDVYVNGTLISPQAGKTYSGVIAIVPSGQTLPSGLSADSIYGSGSTANVIGTPGAVVASPATANAMPAGGEAAVSGAASSTVAQKAAVYVENSTLTADKEYGDNSTVSLSGTVTDTSATDLYLTATDFGDSGLVVSGGNYTVGGSKDHYKMPYTVMNGATETGSYNSALLMKADTASATTGGAAATVAAGGVLNIVNTYLQADGAQRYVTSAYDDSELIVNDSAVVSTGVTDSTQSQTVPFSNAALLISGRARANFSIGATATYYFNSVVSAEGWAALSTDSATGDGLDLYAYNTKAYALHGGYATYADNNCRDTFYGSTLTSAEVGAIISNNGSISFLRGSDVTGDVLSRMAEGGAKTDAGTVVIAGRNAVQLHAPDMSNAGVSASQTAQLTVVGSTLRTDAQYQSTYDYTTYGEATVKYVDFISGAAILAKSTSASILLDGSKVESYNNILLLTALNSDSMGNFLQSGDGATVDGVNLEIRDSEVTGDVKHYDYQRSLTVNLTNGAVWNGAADTWDAAAWNACWAAYEGSADCNWLVDDDSYESLGTTVTVDGTSVWNVTGESKLAKLVIATDGAVNGVIAVDGQVVDGAAGTYTGVIVVTAK